MNRLEFIKSLLFSPSALLVKDKPTEDEGFPVKEFRYQTKRGRPWVMFLKRGNPIPCWFYWVYPEGKCLNDYQLPKERNPGKPEEWMAGEGWAYFENGESEINVNTPNEYMSEHFPDTKVIAAQIYLEWQWEEKQRMKNKS